MVLKCQEDSFLQKLTTKVVACEPGSMEWPPKLSLSALCETRIIHGFNVICENTILFPAGGGQPCDYGTINNQPVRNVTRQGSKAVHFVECSKGFDEGMTIEQCLDWPRRLDHMQQHSGQHLITEMFVKEFNHETTSWSLGSEISYIELNTKHQLSPDSLNLIEGKCNDEIREGKPVHVVLMDPNSPEMAKVRARALPKDVDGPVRVIRIEGQTDNMCCGTHVHNLSQIQAVKLLYAEVTKTGVHVYFLAGERILKRLGECFQREQSLNLTLKGGPNQHLELIQKLQSTMKLARKSFQKVLKDLAKAEAEKLVNQQEPRPLYYCLHRQDGIEPDFINIFLKYAPDNIELYFLTTSDMANNVSTNAKGQLVLKGKPDVVQYFGGKLLDILNGKGNGRDGYFQGKFTNIDGIPECEVMIKEYYLNKST